MKHVFFALYDGREYTIIEPGLINYYLGNNVDVYAAVINLPELEARRRIKLSEDVYFDLLSCVTALENFGKLIRLTVVYYAEGDFTGRFTKEYDIDESQITRIKL